MTLINDSDQVSSSENISDSSKDERGRNGSHAILNDLEVLKTFMAVIENVEGRTLPKNARRKLFYPMAVQILLNSTI